MASKLRQILQLLGDVGMAGQGSDSSKLATIETELHQLHNTVTALEEHTATKADLKRSHDSTHKKLDHLQKELAVVSAQMQLVAGMNEQQ